MGDVFEEYSEKNHEELPALMIIQGGGTIRREESDRNLMYDKGNLANYKLIKEGDFIVHLRSFEGGLEVATNTGIISPAYHTFHGENTDSIFYYSYFRSRQFIDTDLKPHVYGIRDGRSIDINGMKTIPVPYTILGEQRAIGKYIETFDKLITLHQRKYEYLCGDKIVLRRIYANDWEQRKFSELVQIERGGSPRPIDDYITDNPNGLNWVKIGDAPQQGHYITKTTEKIKPEGLSKTREVHPGDLILSNSMSFGKPYIMGIDGCIHDGWLLIRDNDNIFDLTFLCHLLGTPQMLNQYRSFAAGSTVNNLNKELVGNTIITIPKIDEQQVLGQYLENIDNLITLHQRKP